MNFSRHQSTFFLNRKKELACLLYGIFSLLVFVKTGFAQNTVPCISDQVLQEQIKQNPAIQHQIDQFNTYAKAFKDNVRTRSVDTIRIIPVVFHVFHENGSEDISDEQLRSQIDVLNIDYRRLNPDTVNLDVYQDTFKVYGADMKINFRMATIDPNGNCTNGIVRYYTPFTENADDAIKALSVWPTDKYLNIWVVKNIKPTGLEPGQRILGYAQFPFLGSGLYYSDGIIMVSDYTGNSGTSDNVSKLGRVATHEIGHWFGLYHPFQDSCYDGDQVDDTPPVASPSFHCPIHKNSCHGDRPDLPDLVPDFMDYADGSCQNLFTKGQKARADATISVWRTNVISAANLIATGTQDNAPVPNCAPVAAFDAPRTTACAGGTISFYDYSYNATVSSRTWFFPGGNPATTALVNPTVTYANAGAYDVTLIVKGAYGTDTITKKAYISVNPTNAWVPGIAEGFEEASFPNNWTLSGNGSANWQRTTLAAHSGSASMMVLNTGSTISDVIDFISPNINPSLTSSENLSFYYAYTPLASAKGTTNDKLTVYLTTNCGASWISLWTKSGTTLNTLDGITTDPGAGPFYAVLSSDWKQASINLAAYARETNVMFKFEFTSAAGNNIFVDDINMGTAVTGVQQLSANKSASLEIFPNPAAESATLKYSIDNKAPVRISLFDVTGRKLMSLLNETVVPGEYELNLNSTGLSQGTYIVELQTPGQLITKKLILL